MVKNLIRNGVSLLYIRQTNILTAATVIMSTVLVSRLLGLLKNRLLTARFTPDEIGIYFAAFRLPNMLFDLLVLGVLSTAFIPVFTKYLAEGREKEGWYISSAIINIGALIFIVLSALFILFTEPICRLIAPGLTSTQISQMVAFTRIMIVGQALFLLIGNFLTGILQSYKHFLVPALAPITYNIGIILGILFLTPSVGLYAPVWGVVIGSVLFMAIQIPFVRAVGFRHKWTLDYKNPGVKKIGKLMLPRTLGLAVNQINLTVNLALSSLLGARSITVLNFAQQLNQFPVSLFGATIAQAALPTLSEESAKDKSENFKTIFLTSFHQILFLVFPAAAILIILRIPAVRLIFGASKFDWPATVLTGRTLAFLSLGLVFESLIHLLARGFYAIQDTKTPVLIGIIAVIVNVLGSFIFIWGFHLPIWGLALSTTLSDIVNAILLLLLLDKKVRFEKNRLFIPALKMSLAALFTGVFLYVPMKLLDQLVFDTTKTINLIMLTSVASIIGLSVYLFLAFLLDIKELSTFVSLTQKITNLKRTIRETPKLMEAGEQTE